MQQPSGMSCVLCAFNEADRIGAVLSVVSGHPLLDEVIVVDDGSTDATALQVAAFRRTRLISYSPNRGKAHALARGIAAAQGEHVMLLDADLGGLSAQDIADLAAPVLAGVADASISLRRNSLAIYRAIGLDFVSGERVLPSRLLKGALGDMEGLPGWGAEAFMNRLIIAERLRLAVVRWPGVVNIRKHHKVGPWRGAWEEARMIADAASVLGPVGLVTQNLGLLRLTRPPRAAAWRRRLGLSYP